MAKKSAQPLLPVGFYDLLFDEAENNHRKINATIDFFLNSGYRLIKTPLVEFADNFSSEEIENSFVISDVISGKNMVLRNDITLQISRLLNGRFQNEKLPLKLCYVGDILLTKSRQLYADRQSTQVGLEIIGCNQTKSQLEIITLVLQILPKILQEKLLIEFSLPNFAQNFCDELQIEKKEELIEAIKQKNISLIKRYAGQNTDIVAEIALTNNNFSDLSRDILRKINSPQIAKKLQKAQEIIDFVATKFPHIQICCDLFGDSRNLYYQEFSFDIFCGDFSYPIARGGKYKINDLDAVGATIYMNYLRKV